MPTPNLAPATIQLSDLRPDPRNARTHDHANIGAIKDSLNTYGQVAPLLARRSDMVIIGGHGRYVAMQQLGWQSAQVVLLDLSAHQSQALGIVLNRSAELGAWDMTALEQSLNELSQHVDITSLGFNEAEIQQLVNQDPGLDLLAPAPAASSDVAAVQSTVTSAAADAEQPATAPPEQTKMIQLFYGASQAQSFHAYARRAQTYSSAPTLSAAIYAALEYFVQAQGTPQR